jgi:hypothetical protein
MNSVSTKKLLVILCAALIFASCKKDVVSETTSKKSWDETVKAVALDVSKKMNSLSFRKMLKHEVSLRFDGDANILISSLVKRLPKYLAWEAKHSTASRSSSSARIGTNDQDLLASFSFNILEEAAVDYPQMQLAVQPDADTWDPSIVTPSVVYLTADYDEATSLTISGYDTNQTPISVSATEDPLNNYVVVSENERTVYRGSETLVPTLVFTVSNCPVEPTVYDAPYNPDYQATALQPADFCSPVPQEPVITTYSSQYSQYNGVGQDGVLPTLLGAQQGAYVQSPTNGSFSRLAPVGTFNGTVVYRKNFRHEKMRYIRCDDIGKIEGWPAGAPEIRLVVFEQNVLNPSENLQIFKEEFEPARRKDIKEKWWDASGVTMHLWDYSGTGTKASFGYYEYDPVVIPNETLVAIGELTVDLLFLQSVDSSTTTNQMTIYGNIRQSVATGIRSLKKKNGMSEYIGKDDYSVFNDEDNYNHNPGGTKFQTWPDL